MVNIVRETPHRQPRQRDERRGDIAHDKPTGFVGHDDTNQAHTHGGKNPRILNYPSRREQRANLSMCASSAAVRILVRVLLEYICVCSRYVYIDFLTV